MSYTHEQIEKAKHIRLLVCDVDGVLTDGKIHIAHNGELFKSFNVKDGLGIKLLREAGIETALITARHSELLSYRAKELGITHIYQGQKPKRPCFESLIQQFNLETHQVAYVGDDLPDLELIMLSGLGITVNDGVAYVKDKADWVTRAKGGCGAVREIAEFLLIAQKKFDAMMQSYEL